MNQPAVLPEPKIGRVRAPARPEPHVCDFHLYTQNPRTTFLVTPEETDYLINDAPNRLGGFCQEPATDGKIMLSPSTIFNTVTSFMTNTNLQHYSGEQHLSYFNQLVFVLWNMFLSAAVGFCALTAMIRGLRGDAHMGNYYLDMWRAVVYVFLPASLLMGVLFIALGMPMTFDGIAETLAALPAAPYCRSTPA